MVKQTKRNYKAIIWNSLKALAVIIGLGIQYLDHAENVMWHRFQYEVTIQQLEAAGVAEPSRDHPKDRIT